MSKNLSNLPKSVEEKVSTLPSFQNESLVKVIRGLYQGKPLLGSGGLLTNLVKDLTQIALQCEMDNHLQEIYGLEVSSATISAVTDKLVPMRMNGGLDPLNQSIQCYF